MTKEEKHSLANWAVQCALEKGAQQVSVTISENSSSGVEIRDQKIDKLEQSIQCGLSIRLFVDKKYSSHSTNRLKKDELARFIEQAIEGTRFLTEDAYRSLPDAQYIFKGEGPELMCFDPEFSKITPQEKIDLAKSIEKKILDTDERILSITSSYYDGISNKIMVNSNGFTGNTQHTYFGLNVSVSVKDDDARPESYWSEGAIFYSKLKKTGISEKALTTALQKIGQKKVNSATLPMIVENRQVGKLLGPVLSALSGAAIQQKNSFLMDKLNEKVVSSKLTLVDDPHMISGRASRLFDAEGMATKKRSVFTNGVLNTYFMDTYYANKLGVEPTTASTSNLVFKVGNKSLEALIQSLDKGILVTGFNGGNCNGTTGDFSYGIEGFLIEKGVKVQSISEMNITGNMLSLWTNLLELGNDVNENSSLLAPSILFDHMAFSGV